MNAPAQLDERLPAVLRTVSESFATHAVRPDQLHTTPVDGIRILGVMECVGSTPSPSSIPRPDVMEEVRHWTSATDLVTFGPA